MLRKSMECFVALLLNSTKQKKLLARLYAVVFECQTTFKKKSCIQMQYRDCPTTFERKNHCKSNIRKSYCGFQLKRPKDKRTYIFEFIVSCAWHMHIFCCLQFIVSVMLVNEFVCHDISYKLDYFLEFKYLFQGLRIASFNDFCNFLEVIGIICCTF